MCPKMALLITGRISRILPAARPEGRTKTFGVKWRSAAVSATTSSRTCAWVFVNAPRRENTHTLQSTRSTISPRIPCRARKRVRGQRAFTCDCYGFASPRRRRCLRRADLRRGAGGGLLMTEISSSSPFALLLLQRIRRNQRQMSRVSPAVEKTTSGPLQ